MKCYIGLPSNVTHLYPVSLRGACSGLRHYSPDINPLDSETFELHGSDGGVEFQIIVGPYMTVIHIISPEQMVEHDWGFCDDRVLTPNRRRPLENSIVYKHSKRMQVAAFKLGYIFEDLESLSLEPITGHSAMEHTLRFSEDLELIQLHLGITNNQLLI